MNDKVTAVLAEVNVKERSDMYTTGIIPNKKLELHKTLLVEQGMAGPSLGMC